MTEENKYTTNPEVKREDKDELNIKEPLPKAVSEIIHKKDVEGQTEAKRNGNLETEMGHTEVTEDMEPSQDLAQSAREIWEGKKAKNNEERINTEFKIPELGKNYSNIKFNLEDWTKEETNGYMEKEKIGEVIRNWAGSETTETESCRQTEENENEEMTKKRETKEEKHESDIECNRDIYTFTRDRRENKTKEKGKSAKKLKDENKPMKLLKDLGLQNMYPKKMKKTDALVINKISTCDTQPKNDKELPHYYLKKLIMMDYRMQYLLSLEQEKNRVSLKENQNTGGDDAGLSFADFLNDSTEDSTEMDTQQPAHIHPMDLQMALLHCANNLLKQYLYSKLYLCQYALPFLVPNPCSSNIELPLWSLRHIKISCKDKETKTSKECTAVHLETKVVSFMRLGSSSVSKSQIMNMVLNRQKHSIFFSRHCRGSRQGGLLMDGVVDMTWYIPGGRQDDIFSDCIAFTNLHGDARENRKQFQFLNEISAVNVLLMSDSDLNEEGKAILKDCFESPQPLICLHTDKSMIKGNKPGIKIRIGIKDRNEAELTDALISVLSHCWSLSKKRIRIEECSNVAVRHGFVVDEDSKNCKKGRDLAENVVCILKDNSLLERKEAYLPLQGQMWHKWCQKDKELYRLKQKGNKSIEQYKSEIEIEKEKIREEQLKRAFPLNDFMRPLIDILGSHSNEIKMYFLEWLRIFLDELLADAVPKLQQKYHDIWSKIRTLQNKSVASHEVDKLQSSLNDISSQINDCTFGLEHILREISQIFEASHTGISREPCIALLPGIAAELLLSGYPLELMDGDAVHVPVKWIASVLDKVQEKLGDVRLFVLSVLGLQSSGKSTLLNAMFGLEFAVSAGRCTRGAFMQLIKADDDIQAELKYEYMLVVDTEGLRATELSNKMSFSHDNELATFVIGLGNMTIINIFGENPSEIQDILQISVQAFLRMKQVKLYPSCLFVHQNVDDTSAKDKNMEARRRLQEKLDEMTQMAAEEEGCDVKCFSDVIRFDVNTHIHYFAHLWEGNPPMAPPNPSYSQNVQDLKRVVLNTVKQQNIDGNKDLIIQRVLTISEFKTKVQDLWRALLTENFVFSFRNSLEITTYCKLEVKYCEWAWELRHNVLQLENRLLNEIENNSKTKTVIVKEVEETYENVKKEIEKYFQQEKNQEILVQWKSKIEKKYEQLKSELIQDLKTKCQELIKAKEKRKKVDENRAQREEKLIKQSKELAEKLRTKDPSEAELQQEFEKLWKKWEKDAASDFTLSPETDIPAQVEEILIDRFRSLPDVYDRVQNSGAMKPCPADYFSLHSLSVAERFLDCASKIYTKCISWARKPKNSGSSNEFSKNFILEQYKQVENVTNNITETVVNYINKKEKEKVDYSPHYIHEMLNLISNNVETCTEINKLTSKEDYKFDLSLHLCKSCIVRFTLMHQAFRTANDPLLYLKSMKDTSYKLFQTLCRGASSVTAFADFLTSRLEDAINQAVRDQVCIDIANEIRQSCPPLKESKIKLEYYLQKELAEKEEFEGFWEYIHFPKTFFKRHISSYVAQHCRKMSCVKIFSERRLDEHYTLVSRVAMKATETSEKLNRAEEKSKVSLWLDLFCADLEKHLKIPRNTLTHMEDEEINDMDFLQESLMDALKRSIKSLKEIFASTSLGDLDNMKQDPEDILFTQMSGCWAQCPFCAAICTNSIEGHPGNHSVPFHRCDGIKGWGYYQTDYLSSDICTTLVSSDNKFILSDNRTFAYKTYKDAGPPYSEWSIVADDSELKYWKWFVCRFQKELEKKYDGKFEGYGKIPSAWRNITKHEILSELEKQMN